MGDRTDRDKPHPPRFPRKRWQPGQAERAEPPHKGGAYDRPRDRRRVGDDLDEELDGVPPPAPPPPRSPPPPPPPDADPA